MLIPALHIPPALKYRPFRLLWLGLLVSIAGGQMQMWALFWHVRDLTEAPIAQSGIGLARILPVIAFSLLAGVVADVVNRRRLLFVTQSALALLALALALLTFAGKITLWQIYTLTALQAAVMAFDLPARQSLTPSL
ncbi:MAG: MFS transporter, partial [Chloroflexi bacterium]|nr:MFS transporter [Chloroflexota bacterium]